MKFLSTLYNTIQKIKVKKKLYIHEKKVGVLINAIDCFYSMVSYWMDENSMIYWKIHIFFVAFVIKHIFMCV